MSVARSAAAAGTHSQPGSGRALFWPLLSLLVVASWAVLFAVEREPVRALSSSTAAGAMPARSPRSVARSRRATSSCRRSLHAAAWVLMIAAMMLPTTFPLLAMFRRITGARPDAGRLAALVVLGFLAAWLAFGVVGARSPTPPLRYAAARSDVVRRQRLDGRRRRAGRRGPVPVERAQVPLPRRMPDAVRIRRRALARACRRRARRFRIGVDHGIFCVGCCWALMLMMFVVGIGSVGWMLALAAVMAAEKNLPCGRRLRTPVGLGLLAGRRRRAVTSLRRTS